jgi:regulator of sigma E protease
MQDLLFTAASFIVALAFLIAVHEFGHFWVARTLGVRVLRFSIGFGRPLLRHVSPRDGTEYVVAAIPLGGYVKMLDEREEPVPPEEVHRAFNRQRLWKRFAIVAAGPLFNFLFAILAYWAIFVAGDAGNRALVGEVEPQSVAAEAGFSRGDEILGVADRKTPTWEAAVFALMAEVMDGEDLTVRVRRSDGDEATLVLEGRALQTLPDDPAILGNLGLSPARPVLPPVIGELVPGEPAEQGGLASGDRILAVDEREVAAWSEVVDAVQASPGQALELTVERDGRVVDLTLVPRPVEGADGQPVGRIGAGPLVPEGLYDAYRTQVQLGPVEAIGAAVEKTADMSVLMVRVIGRMLLGQASIENLSGPITIAETAGKTASVGLGYFIKFLAVVSISLGVLNLLPIPILDGGHLLYFVIEGVKGSPLSERIQIQGQKIGIVLLLALMTLAFYVDISRLLG